MLDNDRTIFDYINPCDNLMLSSMEHDFIDEMVRCLDKYYLEYRDSLGLSNFDTFGIEIEIEHFIGYGNRNFLNSYLGLAEAVGSKKWDSRNDQSLNQGREFVSEILIDDIECWKKIRNACAYVGTQGKIDVNCGSHVHAGAQILGENSLYWYRLFKIWSIYENVIYRFSYGEYLTHRPQILKYARPAACFYDERLRLLDDGLNYGTLEMLKIVEPSLIIDDDRWSKKFGLSYWRMLADDNYDMYEDFNKLNVGCTVEFRTPNPTLDEVVWQNNINFFIKLMLYCKSDNFDMDILNRRYSSVCGLFDNLWAYSSIYLDQALELCDLIFDNNLDKIYFLRQYLKSFQVSDKPFVKSRSFTFGHKIDL